MASQDGWTPRRLTDWLATSYTLPETGRIGVFNAWSGIDLPGVTPDRIRAVQPNVIVHDQIAATGIRTAQRPNYSYDATIIVVPRQKERALSYIKAAVARTASSIILDGQKTDGIESLLKLCRARFSVREVVSRHHGKLFWFAKRGFEKDVMEVLDLPEPTPVEQPFGYHTAPGVFSADGPDPGSVLLAGTLPAKLGPAVADLGAGWGYLARQILERSGVASLDMVEADAWALDCAKVNVPDPRAQFHWADATAWGTARSIDTVVMNPPFHVGRTADPDLGRAFIANAARLLKPSGALWLVANRHLPYEAALHDRFARVEVRADSGGFKVIEASRPVTRQATRRR